MEKAPVNERLRTVKAIEHNMHGYRANDFGERKTPLAGLGYDI